MTSPGNHPLVITVGAMRGMGTAARGDDLIASYSSKGPSMVDQVIKPDIVAPGNQVAAPMLTNTSLYGWYTANEIPKTSYTGIQRMSNTYFRLSGTSMAAPVVAGTVALMLQKEPGLTPDTVKLRLMKTATKSFPTASVVYDAITGQSFPSQYDIFTVGPAIWISRPLLRRPIPSRPANMSHRRAQSGRRTAPFPWMDRASFGAAPWYGAPASYGAARLSGVQV